MEPITLFGLAVNVIQLIDFSAKLLRGAHEIHHSSTGETTEHTELRRIAESLSRMCDDLSSSNAEQAVNRLGLMGREISELAAAAKNVAGELIAVITRLTRGNDSGRRWRSFRQALATLWKKGDIENLQARLSALRGQLQANMITRISFDQGRILENLTSLWEEFQKIQSPRTIEIDELIRKTKLINANNTDIEKRCLENIQNTLKDLSMTTDKYTREKYILDSLRYQAMLDRYHVIPEAHQKTFDWIFEPHSFPASDPRSTIALKDWLTSGDGIFWVGGKPGSGKSTLMRYLCDCPQTKSFLLSWAEGSSLATAAYYFWMAGTELQRSQRGLYRQLLYEILREHPDLITTICSDRWTAHQHRIYDDWTLDELRSALSQLQGITSHTKICFFLDGLDEYEGHPLDLINIIVKISENPHIKLCVSSREWPAFEDAFGSAADRKLYLEDLTRDDIRRFSHDKLAETPQFDQFRLQQAQYVDLVDEITRKAQGVFLWVFLVVRSLRDGLINGDSPAFLRQRLDELPSDLEAFFEKLIDSVDRVYQRQMAVVFQVALRAPNPIDLLTYWLMDEEAGLSNNVPMSWLDDILKQEDGMKRRLYGRYKGLLEPVGEAGRRKVNFLHRTVRDYLQTKSAFAKFAFPNLNPHTIACKAFISYMARYGAEGFYRVVSLEYFVIFARWAETHNEPFDLHYVSEMRRYACRTFGSDMPFFKVAARYGYISGLRYIQSQDPQTFESHRVTLVWAALDTQTNSARAIFGVDSVLETLAWLLPEETKAHTRLGGHELLLQFLLSEQCRDEEPSNSQQWKESLKILLRRGGDLNKAFSDPRLTTGLPWIGSDWRKFYKDLGLSVCPVSYGLNYSSGLQVRASVEYRLDSLLDAYSAMLEHGLDPNKPIGNHSIWQTWLWYICEWQETCGLFDTACIKVLKVFLSHDADPHATVSYSEFRRWESGDQNTPSNVSASAIIASYFTDGIAELEPILQDAVSRWSVRKPSVGISPLLARVERYESRA